jgi:hypothetical protein
MATGAQAIARLTTETGLGLSAIDRTSVALQAAKLWPIGRRGGGRSTPHTEPAHLTNIAIAMCVADPITAAAEWVARYRPLVLAHTLEVRTVTTLPDGSITTTLRKTDGRRSGMAISALHHHGNTFGAWMDGLLEESAMVRDFMWSALEIAFVIDREFPEASMTVTYSMPNDLGLTVETNRFLIKHEEDMPALPPRLAVQPHRTVTIPFRLFEVLREVGADTVSHQIAAAEMERI